MAKATKLSRQRNAFQRVLMGILGRGVHDAGRASSFPTCLARCLQQAPLLAERSRGTCQGEVLEAEAEDQAGIAAQCC